MKIKRYILNILLACFITSFVSGCTTPYGPHTSFSGTGGYTDKKISEGAFLIESLVNVPTGPDKAFEYWHRRAKELCNGSNYSHDAKLITHINKSYNSMTGGRTNHNWPLVVGTAKCNGSK